MRFSIGLSVCGVFVMCLMPRVVSAGIWVPPTGPQYIFDSLGEHTVVDTPFGALQFTGTGLTLAQSDPTNAALGGLDTINTEILSMTLTGNFAGLPATLIAGAGNTFFPGGVGLQPTRGQVQDKPGAPIDGQIDFPANSIFDVFFDVWVDGSTNSFPNGVVEVGEVFSNDLRNDFFTMFDSFAARMSTMPLDLPPPVGTVYTLEGGVFEFDPMIGTFEATQFGAVKLYRIRQDRESIDGPLPFGTLDTAAHTVLPPVPEPTALCVWSVISLLGACFGWRRKRQVAAGKF